MADFYKFKNKSTGWVSLTMAVDLKRLLDTLQFILMETDMNVHIKHDGNTIVVKMFQSEASVSPL